MSTLPAWTKTTTTSRFVLIAVIAIVVTGLATLDKFLARAEETEVHRTAQQAYFDGLQLRRAGKIDEAIEAFRKAHALERRRAEYELELVDALISAGKLDQAALLVRDVLDRAQNNGRANLLAARLMVKKGESNAQSYYHRAIYGEWHSDAVAHRVSARMELADYLAKRGRQQELLAELLPLQEEAGNSPSVREHLAELFLAADSPSRAADQYRALIKQNPDNVKAYEGVGEAVLRLGEYHQAHNAFLTAVSKRPDDPGIRQKLELSTTLMALDPTPRKLRSIEKYHRSLQILDLVRSNLEECLASHPSLDSEDARELITSANDVLAKKPRSGVTNEMAEDALTIAEKTWQVRIKVCGTAMSQNEKPLQLIVDKVGQ
jgi:tetratricopeptide (TPR) repeat protein